MKVSFIVPCSNLTNYGVRVISSYLKSKGHQVELIFVLIERNNFRGVLSQDMLNELYELVSDSGLVGISVMTNFLGYTQQITKAINSKNQSIPIVWGGVQPTVDPERCMQDVRIICRGEGENPILELVETLEKGWAVEKIKNLWVNKGGKIYRNEVRRLIKDLNVLPDPDYDLSSQFILKNNYFVPLDKNTLKDNMIKMGNKSRYSVFSSRGCPGKCHFCINDSLKDLYQKKGLFVRKRSVKRVIQELKNNIKTLGFESVCIQDEDFMVRTFEEIKEFCEEYKKEINLPFQCEFSPRTFDVNKVKQLIEVGLSRVQVGIQSVNEGTNYLLYNRKYSMEEIDRVVGFFSRYPEIICNLHFLVHNPWESEASLISSIRFVSKLSEVFNIKLYPLVFYPGTRLYDRAFSQGLIKDFFEDVVYKDWSQNRVKDSDYLTLIFYLLVFIRGRKVLCMRKLSFLFFILTSRFVRTLFKVPFVLGFFRTLFSMIYLSKSENRP